MRPAGFADLHQHVLWGLDDGPRTPQQMYALLRQNIKEGIQLIFATTHAYPRNRQFDMPLYRQRLAEANAYCESMGWPLRILPGCEIHYCPAVADILMRRELPTMGDSRYVLIEFAPDVLLRQVRDAADSLYRAGYLPVIAHVERYRCLVRAPERAADIREEYGLLYQMNCSTVLRPGGFWKRSFVRRMLQLQAIDAIATDAHDSARRPARMRAAHQRIARRYGADYAQRLACLGWEIVKSEPDGALR